MLFGDWVDPRPDARRRYQSRVSKTDADGNEVGGIRLPDIAVPLATYTGWNLYQAPFPDGELCDRDDLYKAFAVTRAERAGAGEPRPSLQERYAGPADYAHRVTVRASELVRQRLLLQEDAEAHALQAQRLAQGVFSVK